MVTDEAAVGLGRAGDFNAGIFTNSLVSEYDGTDAATIAATTESVEVSGSAYVTNVFGGTGRDDISINGNGPGGVEVGYWVTAGGGSDVITIDGTATVGAVQGDGGMPAGTAGDDVITFAAGSNVQAKWLDAGGGDDIVNLAGSGRISPSATTNTAAYGPYAVPAVTLGAGADSVTVSEAFTVDGDIVGGTGSDTVTITDTAAVTSTIQTGDDDDRIVISATGSDFTVDGGSGGVNNDTLDLTALYALFGQPVLVQGADAQSGTLTFDTGSGTQVITFSAIENLVVCFTAGTQIDTIAGRVAVDTLETGDLVRTADHGYQPVRWVGQRKLSGAELRANPNMYPIRIRKGTIGDNMPECDILVSPQHRVLVKSKIASRMFAADEVLVAAKHLVALDGIAVATDVDEVTYVHFMCAQHEIVYAEGMASETLFTGAQALKSLSAEARGEIFGIFPELLEVDLATASVPARPFVAGRRGRQLASRHSNNGKPLVGAA